jgi:hypothetical protein
LNLAPLSSFLPHPGHTLLRPLTVMPHPGQISPLSSRGVMFSNQAKETDCEIGLCVHLSRVARSCGVVYY